MIVSAFGPPAAEVAARSGDGLWTGTDAETSRLTPAGGHGPGLRADQALLGGGLRGGETERTDVAQRRNAGQLSQDLPTPSHFEMATEHLTQEQIVDSIACGPDPSRSSSRCSSSSTPVSTTSTCTRSAPTRKASSASGPRRSPPRPQRAAPTLHVASRRRPVGVAELRRSARRPPHQPRRLRHRSRSAAAAATAEAAATRAPGLIPSRSPISCCCELAEVPEVDDRALPRGEHTEEPNVPPSGRRRGRSPRRPRPTASPPRSPSSSPAWVDRPRAVARASVERLEDLVGGDVEVASQIVDGRSPGVDGA